MKFNNAEHEMNKNRCDKIKDVIKIDVIKIEDVIKIDVIKIKDVMKVVTLSILETSIIEKITEADSINKYENFFNIINYELDVSNNS